MLASEQSRLDLVSILRDLDVRETAVSSGSNGATWFEPVEVSARDHQAELSVCFPSRKEEVPVANRRIGGAGGGSDPGPGKSAGTAVAAGTLAVALASSGGAFSTGSAVTAGSEAAVSQSASAAARNVASRIPKKNKSSAQRSIRRGRANEAWKRLGLRKLRQSDKVPALDCVAHSFGEVREFLARSPCRSLDRIVFTLDDAHGNSAVVSVAWVDFRNRSTVRRFERLEDRHGTGDIKALGSSILGVHDVDFTGHHYNAQRRRTTLTIAEAETLSGSYSTDDLNTITDIASLLPRP